MKESDMFTHKEKLSMFEHRQYMFTPPVVTTTAWSLEAWLCWIDSHGKWLPPKNEVQEL